MEKLDNKKIETKEDYPDHMKVFRVRHSETEYKELFGGELKEGDFDLTDKGMEQIEAAAQRIAAKLDRDNDVICIISSPIRRTRDSAKIMREYFHANNYEVWEDPKGRTTHPRIRAVDFLDENGQALEPGDENYTENIKRIIKEIDRMKPEGMPSEEFYYNNSEKIPQGEKYEDVKKRVATHMRGLQMVARSIQPKVKKRIVIVQLEHGETVDAMLENASSRQLTGKKGTGAKNAEILELTIPVKGDGVDVNLMDR